MVKATVKVSNLFDARIRSMFETEIPRRGRRVASDTMSYDAFLCPPGFYSGLQFAQMNRVGITPLLYDPSGVNRPKMLGYNWTSVWNGDPETPMQEREPWIHVYRPLVEDAKDYWKVKHISDHQMPMPTKTNKWRPTCYVKVEQLTHLPLWLLLDPFKVSFGGTNKKKYGEYFTEKEWEQGKHFLSGLEILERLPFEKSIMLSVAGWPLWTVPIKYLVWFASYGTLDREVEIGYDASILHYDEIWKDGKLTITERYIGQAQNFPDLLRPKVIEYLNSAEGQTRLKEIDFSDYLPNEEIQDYDFGGNGTWTGKNDDAFYYDRKKGLIPISVEHYSISDKDRFGKWGSSPVTQFLMNGNPRSMSQRIVASALQGDIDPTPHEFRLGSRGEAGESQSLWTSPLYEEEMDWIPPSLPLTFDAAYRQGLQILGELESLKLKWTKLHHPYYRPTDSKEFREEQEQDLIDMSSKDNILANHCLGFLEGSPLWEEIDCVYREVMTMLHTSLAFTPLEDVPVPSNTFFVPEDEEAETEEGEWFQVFDDEEEEDEDDPWSWDSDNNFEEEYGYSDEEDHELEEMFA